jgi:hypothetical protein
MDNSHEQIFTSIAQPVFESFLIRDPDGDERTTGGVAARRYKLRAQRPSSRRVGMAWDAAHSIEDWSGKGAPESYEWADIQWLVNQQTPIGINGRRIQLGLSTIRRAFALKPKTKKTKKTKSAKP